MSGSKHSVVIAGAGAIGVCIAIELLRRGHRVCLLDRQAPGSGCSAGNAGILATESIMPLASTAVLARLPAMLIRRHAPVRIAPRHLPALLPWMLRYLRAASPARQARSIATLVDLQAEALPAWRELLDWTGCTPRLREGGWLFAYAGERGFRKDRGERELQRAHGIEWRCVDDGVRARLAPALSGSITHLVHYPQSAWVDEPGELVATLAEVFRSRGGHLLRAALREVRPSAGGGLQVQIDGQTLYADRLVLSLGAHSADWAGRLEGRRPPLQAERGYHLQYAEPCQGLELPVMFADCKIVATPMRGGLRLAGTAEFAGLDRPPDERRARRLGAAVGPLLGLAPTAPAEPWMGQRPTLPDSLPVIDRSQRWPGVFYAFGHQHLGLTLAAVTARRLAGLIEDNAAPVAELSLARFRRG